MASITSTSVNKARELGDRSGNWDYQYRFDLLDNLGGNHIEYRWEKNQPSTHNTDASMLTLAPIILQEKTNVELASVKNQVSGGLNPFYAGAKQTVFLWGLWDEYFKAVCEYCWSLDSLLDVLGFQNVWNSVVQNAGSNTIKTILGISQQTLTALNSDVQVAVNIQTELDAYAPHFNDGIWS